MAVVDETVILDVDIFEVDVPSKLRDGIAINGVVFVVIAEGLEIGE